MSCASLPNIDTGECGNGVVELENGEECDVHAPQGAACRPAGSAAAACRFDCSATACPPGFGCGIDQVCRSAATRYESVARGVTAVSSVQLADMDGDGRSDLLTETAQGLAVIYADERFSGVAVEELALSRGRFLTARLQAPSASDGAAQRARPPSTLVILDTDLSDLGATRGATGGALNVYRGSPERRLLPTLYPSIPVNADNVRLAVGRMSQRVGQLGVGGDALVFTDVSPHPATRGQRGRGYGLGHFAPAEDGSSSNTPLVALPELEAYVPSKTAADYIGIPPVSGPLVVRYQPPGFPVALPYPCDTLAWSQLGAPTDPGAVWLLPLCHLDASVFDPSKAATTTAYLPSYLAADAEVGPVRRAKLVPPVGAVVTGAVTLRDVRRYVPATDAAAERWEDPDGLLDVLVPSASGLLVAYGDGSWTIQDAAPTSLLDSTREWTLAAYPGIEGSAPQALGDFNGDGDLDWISVDGIHFNATRKPLLASLGKPLDRPSTTARVVDLDQDGVDDLAVGSEGGITVYRGIRSATMYPNLNKLEYPLQGTITQLNVGDFDGDGRPDLSYVARTGSGAESSDTAGVLYGTAGFPLPPVVLGSMARLEQLLTIRFSWLLSGVPDAIDSILAYGRTRTGVGAGITLQGKANREMNARFGLSTLDAPLRRGIALSASNGLFAGGSQEGLMLLGQSVEVTRDRAPTGDVTFRIWNTPAELDAQFDVATVQGSEPLVMVPGRAGAPDAEAVRAVTTQFVRAAIGNVDLDGDGVDEAVVALPPAPTRPARLLVANASRASASSTSITYVEAVLDGGGALAMAPENGALRIRFGDFDGDGHRDVVVARPTASDLVATVYFGDGGKQLTVARALSFASLGVLDVVAVPGSDGRSALLALTPTSVAPLVLDFETGAARLGASVLVHGARDAHGLTAGDIDADGVLDLAISSDSGFVLARGVPVLQ